MASTKFQQNANRYYRNVVDFVTGLININPRTELLTVQFWVYTDLRLLAKTDPKMQHPTISKMPIPNTGRAWSHSTVARGINVTIAPFKTGIEVTNGPKIQI